MAIDYVSLLLLNMLAGLFLLSWYVASGMDEPDQKRWAPAFGMVGLVAAVFGGLMAATWPIQGQYGYMYGEMSTVFGIIFLGAALAFGKGWDLRPVAFYALWAGLAAIVLGARIIDMKLTKYWFISAPGFLLSGFAGVAALPTLVWFKDNKLVRYFGALVLIGAGLIWAATAYPEYWMHTEIFQKWVPLLMRTPMPAAPVH